MLLPMAWRCRLSARAWSVRSAALLVLMRGQIGMKKRRQAYSGPPSPHEEFSVCWRPALKRRQSFLNFWISLCLPLSCATHLSRPAFSCVNVTAVFALKKVYGCSGFETSNCFPKLEFASTTPARARIDTGRLRSDLLIGCHAAYVRRRT